MKKKKLKERTLVFINVWVKGYNFDGSQGGNKSKKGIVKGLINQNKIKQFGNL